MRGLLCLAIAATVAPVAAFGACFDYNVHHRVTLVGDVIRETFPGRPNFESIANGDEPETYLLFRLKSPICVHPEQGDLDDGPEENVMTMQMLLTTDQSIKYYRSLMGKTLILQGSFFAQITGHHHTPVLFDNIKFVALANKK